MYLKCLELIGFKSFSDKTRMEFNIGMSAIVGPNGCGKSNVSDSIRWVLGEQSAKMLRGSKMEDVIFNGTDTRKPMGMAEVSLTLGDCENVLGTEYHEVTVTRRVLRSGEGQYFINKTPCRLKDIQRLFMDTGIGTNSYSLMEQGRIDRILSSRPEDRREVFEEASGITKFKADKKEALRKLEQTEANLLRLADIVKEVKRQIISLQRQAGKAARYKKFMEELKSLDLFSAREKLTTLDQDIASVESRMAALTEAVDTLQKEIEAKENGTRRLREQLDETDNDIELTRQSMAELRTQFDRSRESIVMNERRVQDLTGFIHRDSSDMAKATDDLNKSRQTLAEIHVALQESERLRTEAEQDTQAKTRKNAEHENAMAQIKRDIQSFYNESAELELKVNKIQSQLQAMDNEDRNLISRRERCAAEQENLKLVLDRHEKRLGAIQAELATLTESVSLSKTDMDKRLHERTDILKRIELLRKERSDTQSKKASVSAQVEIINRSFSDNDMFSAGARQLLDESNPLAVDRSRILGAMASLIEAKSDARTALEAFLSDWLDAVIVKDWPAALECLGKLTQASSGAVRLLLAHTAAPADRLAAPHAAATRLLDQVLCAEPVQPLFQALLNDVWVVDSTENIPADLPTRLTCVTRDGIVVRGSGAVELYRGNVQGTNPLAQKHAVADMQTSLIRLDETLTRQTREQEQLGAALTACEDTIQDTRALYDERRQEMARQEGEQNMVKSQVQQTRTHLETVIGESQQLEQQGHSVEAKSALAQDMERIRERRMELKVTIESRNQDQIRLEEEHRELQADVMAANVRLAQQRQAVDHMTSQCRPLADRIAQLEEVIGDRAGRKTEFQSEIERLKRAALEAQERIPHLESNIQRQETRLTELHRQRDQLHTEWKAIDEQLKQVRTAIESKREARNQLNTRCVEHRLQRQHLLERVTSEHKIGADAIAATPEPAWNEEEGRLSPETLDTRIAELRSKIEALGPVNTEAIQEYEALEERYEFLTRQQTDLVNAKAQLMEMIKKINETTMELFSKTFAQINENFQHMFKQLFGGGSAKLMLANDEEVLDCGIEIIARPPGKRLQSVSLLSGGERTMTAVALLFAIYMVKPSPFCVLDELDAALDEANIHRFVRMLRGFLNLSQFIVITHNRATISAAAVIYGVTMQETGVSRIVSMKFSDQPPPPEPSAPELTVDDAEIDDQEAAALIAAAPNPPAAATAAAAPSADEASMPEPTPNTEPEPELTADPDKDKATE